MRDLIVPLGVMAATILVALGLVVFIRSLLKMRDERAPEVVHTKAAAEAETRQVTLAKYNLAA
jgi:hypothetical protein